MTIRIQTPQIVALDERHLADALPALDSHRSVTDRRASWSSGDDERQKPYEQDGPLAIVSINGPLSQRGSWWCDGYEAIAKRFGAAIEDGSVQAIVLKISSPGGAVAGLFEAARAMRVAATDAGKPVIAYCDELAASAAYALACVADLIVLPPSGEAGSVGVIAVPMSMSRMLDGLGIDAKIVKSGARKGDLHPAAPLSDAALARLQADVDELASQFAGLVAERRGMSPDAVMALEAGVFMGQAAVVAGLADSVGNLADAKSVALARAQVSSGDSRRRMSSSNDAKRAERPTEKKSMENIAKALGLRADASEGDILVAISEQRALLNGLLAVAGKDSAAEAGGVFRAWQEGSKRAEALSAQLTAIKAERDAADRQQLLDAAVSDGRLAPAAMAEFAKLDLVVLRPLLAALPKTGPVAATPHTAPAIESASTALTAEDRKVAAMLGISEADFLKNKTAQLAARN